MLLLAWQSIAEAQPPSPAASTQPPATQSNPNPSPIRTPQAVPLAGGSTVSLSRSSFYVSPLASSLGSSQRSSSSDELRTYYQSSSRQSLTRVPEMFGDFRRPGDSVVLSSIGEQQRTSVRGQLLSAGGVSGMRIADNNHALPQNRVWFAYNYFHNAADVSFQSAAPIPLSPPRSVSLDRFLFGWERVLFDGNTSIEVRLPIATSEGISGSILAGANAPFRLEGGSTGNLSLIIKRILAASDSVALSYGIGIELPTGSSSILAINSVAAELESTAVHIVPFLAMTRRWNERWFNQSFAQLDVPCNGNSLNVQLANGLNQQFKVNPSVLLQLDTGIGYWLSSFGGSGSRGIAIAAEIHYATQLNGSDSFEQDPLANVPIVSVNSGVEPISAVLNSTVGIQAVLGPGLATRAGVSIPLRDERVFDTEFFLQINRKY